MKAVRPVIASNEVPFLQMMSVVLQHVRRSEGKKGRMEWGLLDQSTHYYREVTDLSLLIYQRKARTVGGTSC